MDPESLAGAGLIVDVLLHQCDCVQENWTEGVFFSPAATLWFAVLATVGVTFVSRVFVPLKDLLAALLAWCLGMSLVKGEQALLLAFKYFRILPRPIQLSVLKTVRTFSRFEDMPDQPSPKTGPAEDKKEDVA